MPPTPPPPPADPRSRWAILGGAALLALAALAAYHHTFKVPFLFDDIPAIVDNPTIRNLGDVGSVLWPRAGYGITVGGRPLLNLSLAVCYAVSGTNVWSYHAFNLLIHILAGLTLFGIVRRTLGGLAIGDCGSRIEPKPPADATGLAFTVALLWTLHPLQTEAVTYVIQRTESMMGLFFLLTLYGFIRAVSAPRPGPWRVLTVLACLGAIASKEVAAVAPVLVLLYDRTFVAGTFRGAWRRRRGLHLSLAATWAPLAVLVASTGWNRGGTAGFNVGVSPGAYWLTQFAAVARYLRQAVWPHPLVFEYGTFWMGLWDAAPYALVVLPVAAATAVALRRRPAAGFLGAWFFAILAPTSVVPGTLQMIVEHRMYLPLAAVIAGAVVGLHAALRRAVRRPLLPCLALALPLGLLTARRNGLYGDDLALWRQTVALSPASANAQSGLGTALYFRHRPREALDHYLISRQLDPRRASVHYNLGLAYQALGRLPEAAAQYREAIQLSPRFHPAHYQLGLALMLMNRTQEALGPFAETVRLMPAMPEAHYEWGVALARLGQWSAAVDQYRAALRLDPAFAAAECDLGTALYQLDRVPEAVACFRRALQEQPDLADAHLNFGLALAKTGSTAQAATEFAEAVRLAPANAAAQFNLGRALAQAGQPARALAPLGRAVQLQPASAEAHFQLGLALARTGRLAEAFDQLQAAVRLAPASAEAHCDLGAALSQAGRLPEAVEQYEAALRLRPDYAMAHYDLGNALLALGRIPEARAHFAAALRLDPRLEGARATLERLPAPPAAP